MRAGAGSRGRTLGCSTQYSTVQTVNFYNVVQVYTLTSHHIHCNIISDKLRSKAAFLLHNYAVTDNCVLDIICIPVLFMYALFFSFPVSCSGC